MGFFFFQFEDGKKNLRLNAVNPRNNTVKKGFVVNLDTIIVKLGRMEAEYGFVKTHWQLYMPLLTKGRC